MENQSNWVEQIGMVLDYVQSRPRLKYHDKIFQVVSLLCKNEEVLAEKLRLEVGLSKDGFMTILSNVTMAIQGKGSVMPLAMGGWYSNQNGVCMVHPNFRKAWQECGVAK